MRFWTKENLGPKGQFPTFAYHNLLWKPLSVYKSKKDIPQSLIEQLSKKLNLNTVNQPLGPLVALMAMLRIQNNSEWSDESKRKISVRLENPVMTFPIKKHYNIFWWNDRPFSWERLWSEWRPITVISELAPADWRNEFTLRRNDN